MPNIVYIVLAGLGLGFLVFIHELGHYFMARRVGMTVEAFSIGFGKAIYAWERKGVKWQVGWLPFGGYVRIKGMEKKGSIEPHQIPDGFFGKSPSARIKVALMGPIFNIIFAFFAFALIWATGGREKRFAEFTHLIGWVDPCSELFEKGVRPGDEITEYNGRTFQGFQDLVFASVTNGTSTRIEGNKIDYTTQTTEPFDYTLERYQNPYQDNGFRTIGVLIPANYLIYSPQAVKKMHSSGSLLEEAGMQPQDRILWVNGEVIFSLAQLSTVINESKTLLTVKRGNDIFLTRVPRLKASDIKFTSQERAELDDWQHAAGLKSKIDQLFFIPYNLTNGAVVEKEVTFFDQEAKECHYESGVRSSFATPLRAGDQILAVDGIPIANSMDLLKTVQQKHVRMIVQRGETIASGVSWKEADQLFLAQIQWPKMAEILSKLGTKNEVTQAGNYVLLAPLTPKPTSELKLSAKERSYLEERDNAYRKQIESIENPEKKAAAERAFELVQKRLNVGLHFDELRDLSVEYNPSPIAMFGNVFKDMWRTLFSLFSGALSPKWMSGPVGIVNAIHHGWGIGGKEALFWMGLISLNLALLNLLPIPVLDGGHVCFSLYEMVTKKPIKAKTMERLVIPFIILLVALFVYLTYHDLVRLFGHFFK